MKIEDIKKLMGGDPVHGLPHVERIGEYFQTYLRMCRDRLNEDEVRLLQFSILVHDIGRRQGYDGDHAKMSAEIMQKKFQQKSCGFTNKEQQIVLFVVKYHNKEISDEDFLHLSQSESALRILRMLQLLDSIDSIGWIGVYRNREWCKKNNIPTLSSLPAEELKSALEKRADVKNKYESFVTISLHNIHISVVLENRAEKLGLLCKEFSELIEEKRRFMEKIIEKIIKNNIYNL